MQGKLFGIGVKGCAPSSKPTNDAKSFNETATASILYLRIYISQTKSK